MSRLFSLFLLLITVTTTLTVVELYRYLQQSRRQEDKYMPFVWNADKKGLENPFIHKHLYRYILNNETVCHSRTRIFLLIYVLSSRKNKLSREIIRRTWASVRVYNGKQVRVVFLTGKKNDGYESSLKSQNDQYGDIIEGAFLDTYENLTYKSVMGLHWVNNYCNNTRFVLKIDDDVVVNIYKLLHFLTEIDSDPKQASGFLYCNVQGRGYGELPIRRNDSKFYMNTTDYKYDLYPPYCQGPGYVFSIDVAVRLFESTKKVPLFKFEDVFMGFCAKVAGIEPQTNFFGFYVDIPRDSRKPFHWTILKHLGTPFKTNATQFEDSTQQNSIAYYRRLCIFSIVALVLASMICIILVICFVPCLCKNIFRFSQYVIYIAIFRIRLFIVRLVSYMPTDFNVIRS